MQHAAALVVASVCLGTASAQSAHLEQLAWLAGCWAAESGERGTGEHWLPLAGGTMLGVGRTVKNGRTVEYEFLQIRLNAEDKVIYIASPSGQRQASFTASSITEGSVTFENPQHDFPQRISYNALAGNRVAARIEGRRGGVLRGVDFPMKRVSCEELAGK
jgi:hypothetical protein